ncbi:MAG TPA: PEGA domain-containing protein [Candidatus Saccharimonadales bacterium]|nr:PEGA domain-containing protein [Candidatus Saccharimonadales bacterium]
MDYLDKGKEFRERILLFVGYILIAVGIVTATLILVYQAYGFGLGKNGSVIQDGLVFFSSQPNPANIYINGTLQPQSTNARIFLPSGIYDIKLTRNGYQDWTRSITVDGGAVEHFDYPMLFPIKLTTTQLKSYSSAPGLMTQSPDRRWLLVEKPGSITDFDLIDLSTPNQPVTTALSIPSNILSKATSAESWKLDAWADDNQHILLSHEFDGKSEYILVDRADPTQSVNLSSTLPIGQDQLTLNNKKYDSYYAYNPSDDTLSSVSLGDTSLKPVLSHVLAFKSYGDNTVLYVTNNGAESGKVLVKIDQAGTRYTIRSLPAGTGYLVDLTTYSGTLYVAVGSKSDNRVYIYQDPVSFITSNPGQGLAPIWVLNVPQPTYLSFSASAQFIIAENGTDYASYDIQNNLGYLYDDPTRPLDPPQANVSWMDGDRVTYVSNGKIVVQEYDNKNFRALVPASSDYLPAFSTNYRYLYTLTSDGSSGQYDLNMTPLMLPADL